MRQSWAFKDQKRCGVVHGLKELTDARHSKDSKESLDSLLKRMIAVTMSYFQWPRTISMSHTTTMEHSVD